MNKVISTILLLSACLLLSSCKLTSVYSKQNFCETQAELASLQIEVPRSELGTEFATSFTNLSHSREPYRFTLKISFEVENITLAIEENSDIVREGVELVTYYELLDQENGKTLLKSSFRNLSGFNTISTGYESFIEKQSVQKHLVKHSANEVYKRLVDFFNELKTNHEAICH